MTGVLVDILPNPTTSSKGGVQAFTAIANHFLTSISTSGIPVSAQPSFGNLSGNIAVSQMNSGAGASSATFWRGDSTWAVPPSSGGAPVALQFTVASGTYSVVASDLGKIVTSGASQGPLTVTLPSPASVGSGFYVGFYKGGFALTVNRNSTEVINFPGNSVVTTFTLVNNYDSVWLVTDGGAWYAYLGTPSAFLGNGSTANFLRGDGIWAPPPSSGADYADMVAFGADPTGVNDCTAAFNAASAASSSIHFGPGTFKFNSPIGYTIPASNRSITIVGAGQGNTILYWPSNNGLTVTVRDQTTCFHIRDLTLACGSANAGTALTINTETNGYANPANTEQSDIIGVSIVSAGGISDVAAYWATGIAITGVSNIAFQNTVYCGGGNGAGTGVSLSGSSTQIPVVFQFLNCTWVTCSTGIYYGNYVQGVTVNQCNFTGLTTGINVTSIQPDMLNIVNSQFNAAYTVYMATGLNISVMNSLIYVQGGSGIYCPNGTGYTTIVGNTFIAFNPASNGVVISGAGNFSVITGNSFYGFTSGTGVFLDTGSSNVNVQSNVYGNNANNVVNNGSGNTVGGGSQ